MGKMEGSCSTGQSPQWAVVPVEEEEDEEEEEVKLTHKWHTAQTSHGKEKRHK
jgi:hypothetical protein